METIEKMQNYGINSLSNAELLSLIIQGGNDKALSVAESVMNYYGTGGELNRASAEELSLFEGISYKKACAIASALELAKRLSVGEVRKRTIKGASDVANILMPELVNEKREHLIALLLNVKGEVISKEVISIGELSGTNVHPREVFSPAIRKGAAAIIIAHNHPSGDPTPSNEDIQATRRIRDAGQIVGIQLLDHVIVGSKGYISMRAENYI